MILIIPTGQFHSVSIYFRSVSFRLFENKDTSVKLNFNTTQLQGLLTGISRIVIRSVPGK